MPDPATRIFAGQVLIDAPGGLLPASGAAVRWTSGESEDVLEEEMHRVAARPDGTFGVSLQSAGTTMRYLVTHPAGTTAHGTASLPLVDARIILRPAATIVAHVVQEAPRDYRIHVMPASHDAAHVRLEQPLIFDGSDSVLRCEGIPARWRAVTCRITFDGGGAIVRDDIQVRFSEETHVRFDVSGSASIIGYVASEEGRRLAGAFVHVYPSNPADNDFEAASTETGHDGEFEIQRVPCADLRVLVSLDGYAPTTREISVESSGRHDLGKTILRRGLEIAGSVLVGGSTASGNEADTWVGIKRARLVSDHAVQNFGSERIGDEGTFRFQGLTPGRWLIWVGRGQRSIRMPWRGTIVELVDTDIRDLRLEPGLRKTWRASVFDRAGHDLGAAAARAGRNGVDGLRLMARGADVPWCAYGETGPGGRVEIDVGEGRFLLGLTIGRGMRWVGVLDAAAVTGTIELPEGRLVLESPAGIADPPERITLIHVRGQLAEELLPLEAKAHRPEPGATEYVLDHLLPGEYTLKASWRRHVRRELTFRVEEGATTTAAWPFGSSR